MTTNGRCAICREVTGYWIEQIKEWRCELHLPTRPIPPTREEKKQMVMTRQERRAMERAKEKHVAALMRAGYSSNWTDITELESTKQLTDRMTSPPYKVMMNGRFIVQMFKQETTWGECIRLMIRWNDARPVHDWQIFQRIKNDLVGEERTAVEVYPKQSNLVDVANMYWLFVLPEGFDCPFEMVEGKFQ